MVNQNINPSHVEYSPDIQGVLIYQGYGNALKMVGKESLDLLQRISTNNLLDLEIRSSRYTILTTEKGRVVDLVLVHRLEEESILLLTSQGQSARILSWISKFIIMEDISINDVSPDVSAYMLLVLKGNSSCNEMLKSRAPAEPILQFHDPLWNSLDVWQVAEDGRDNQDSSSYLGRYRRIGTEHFEELRIYEGVPAWGKELSEQFNPLEAGLSSCISFAKGCYVGQEVIARIDTYKKLQKSLCGFWVESPKNISISRPQEILLGTTVVGLMTSLQWSDRHEKCVALGYLDTEIQRTDFELRSDNGLMCNVHRRSLPRKGDEA